MTNRSVIASGSSVAIADMTLDDQPFFQRWLSESAELRGLIGDRSIPTMEGQMKWFERSKQPDRRMFSILLLPDQTVIGNGGFVEIDLDQKKATFRITIGSPDALGKGYGTEAAKLILSYGFTTMKLSVISLMVFETNTRAIRSYEKAGFQTMAEKGDRAGTIRMMISSERFFSLPA